MLCIPPGAAAPGPCGTVSRDTALIVGTTAGPPLVLFFSEVTQRRKQRLVRYVVPARAQVGPGVYRLALPATLCAGRSGIRHYELFRLVPAFNVRESIGMLGIAC